VIDDEVAVDNGIVVDDEVWRVADDEVVDNDDGVLRVVEGDISWILDIDDLDFEHRFFAQYWHGLSIKLEIL
jgi:hypothetical protein